MSAQPASPNTAPDLVSIEIDGAAMKVPKGSMIIHAADKAGIPIPRFCYHEKLPIAANCRMCLVDVEKAPKPMPACATPVMEGMKVYTQSKRALDSQRNVMEFLLINHPLDCPICDQGGECELQDVAMGYGRSVSRFVERKRVVPDEDIGPLVATDMTRCIQCTRCVRFCSEIAGTFELGGMSRGESLQIGTYIGRSIDNELSGNLIDVCPVGALTNKPFRFRARAWELIARESIGYHDALGSNLYLHTRRGEALRAVPRDNEAINESWLSDRDRYACHALNADDRVTQPLLREGKEWRAVSWDVALSRAAELLKAQPGDELGMLVHPATSNEEGALLAALAKGLGCGHIDHRLTTLDFADVPQAQPFSATLAETEQADAIFLIGCNPRLEAPILGHRVRKAWKRGAKIVALNPVEFDFHFQLAARVLAAPNAMVDRLLHLAKIVGEVRAETPPAGLAQALAAAAADADVAALAQVLQGSRNAVFVLGEAAITHPQASWLRALTGYLARCVGGRVNELPQGANAVGLTRVGVLPGGLDARAMFEQSRRAYLLYGVEPDLDVADPAQVQRALVGATSVVAFAAYASESLREIAHLILPIALLPEIDATLTNAHGEDQRVAPACKAPGEVRAGWKLLRALGERLGLTGFDFVELDALRNRLTERSSGETMAAALAPRLAPGAGLQRISATAVYRSDAVVRRSAPLQAHSLNLGARAVVHPQDALARGLSEGAMVRIDDGRGTATLPVSISAGIAQGSVFIERGYPASAPLAPMGAAVQLSKV